MKIHTLFDLDIKCDWFDFGLYLLTAGIAMLCFYGMKAFGMKANFPCICEIQLHQIKNMYHDDYGEKMETIMENYYGLFKFLFDF